MTGSVARGSTPPTAVYSESLPIGIPIPPDTEIAEPEDALAVGDDDHVDVMIPVDLVDGVVEQLVDAVAERPATRTARARAGRSATTRWHARPTVGV